MKLIHLILNNISINDGNNHPLEKNNMHNSKARLDHVKKNI